MQRDKRIIYFLIILQVMMTKQIMAGKNIAADSTSKRGEYSLIVNADLGLSYYSTSPAVPQHLHVDIDKVNPVGTFRVIWQPDHRLSVGIETGWTTMYSYKLKNAPLEGDLRITSVPLLLEFSMPVTNGFRVFAGAGSYFESSHLNYAGTVNSPSVNLGWMVAGAYTFLSFKKFDLGTEVKWFDAAEAQHAILCAQLHCSWKILTW